jgi:hypothetical protein
MKIILSIPKTISRKVNVKVRSKHQRYIIIPLCSIFVLCLKLLLVRYFSHCTSLFGLILPSQIQNYKYHPVIAKIFIPIDCSSALFFWCSFFKTYSQSLIHLVRRYQFTFKVSISILSFRSNRLFFLHHRPHIQIWIFPVLKSLQFFLCCNRNTKKMRAIK